MSKRISRFLAAMLSVGMVLSLFCTPAWAARPLMEEGEAAETAEIPAGEEVGAMPRLIPTAAEHPTANGEETAALSAATCTCSAANPHKTGSTVVYPDAGAVHYLDFHQGTTLTVKINTDQDITGSGSRGKGLSNNGGLDKTKKTFGVKTDSASAAGVDTYITFNIAGAAQRVDIKLVDPDAHQHSWDSGVVTKAATCTAEGTKLYTCTDPSCGATREDSVDMLPHTVVDVPAVPVKCVTDGATAGTKCSVCDTVLSGCEVIKATGTHNFGAGSTCADCGVTKHGSHPDQWDDLEITKPATCTVAGEKTVVCRVANCGETKTVAIPAPGHSEEAVAAVEGNCTTDAVTAGKKCSVCGEVLEGCVVTPAPGHTFVSGECSVCHALESTDDVAAGGWFETIYAVVDTLQPEEVAAVSYRGAMKGALDKEAMKYLVRPNGATGTRIDIPGLIAGTYDLVVTDTQGTAHVASDIAVKAHDRSGWAHYQYTEGVGAYRDDGVLKDEAIVLYVTDENKDTVTVTSMDGTTVTGIGHILNSHGRDVGGGKNSKGGLPNNNQAIMQKLSEDNTPLVVRIIGNVTRPDGVTAYDSIDYGGSEGDNGGMVRIKAGHNVTIEGIGDDATIDGWGIHFMCQSSDYPNGWGRNFEVRNITFRNVPEDCIGMEGIQDGGVLTAPVERVWVHNCSFFKPTIANPAESDKDGGDGACDFKRGQYMTMDYCYFEGYHKANLVGSSDTSLQYHITWHHNWWKDCESRGPLARQTDMHIYNCLYQGSVSYAMNTRANAYIFSEYNIMENCKNPMRVDAGAIKSYNDILAGCFERTEGIFVDNRNEKVTCSNLYANFDTDPAISYVPSGAYKLDTDPAVTRGLIAAYCGPMKAPDKVVAPEEVDTSKVASDRRPAAAVALPFDKDINNALVTSAKSKVVADNIVFFASKIAGESITIGGDDGVNIGQSIVFKVDQAVDVTIHGTGKNYAPVLLNENGLTVIGVADYANGAATASNLPAGTYFIQTDTFSGGKYKESIVSHLTIEATKSTVVPHVHTYSTTPDMVTPATCTRTGTKLYKCTGTVDNKPCDGYYTEDIPMTDHTYAGGECSVCHVLEGTFGEDSSVEAPALASLTLSETGSIELEAGATLRVIATVTPANAAGHVVEWTSSDETVATVAKNGTIRGVKGGECTVTAAAGEGGARKSVTLNVKVVDVTVTSYTFKTSDYISGVKDDTALTADNVTAIGTKTSSHFTVSGSVAGTKWRTNNTPALLLAGQEGSALEVTVSEKATGKTLSIQCASTGKSNYSAIALVDAAGNRVVNTDGKTVEAVYGNSGTVVSFANLPAGTYKIVAPAAVTASELDDLEDLSTNANDVNARGVRIITATLTESIRSDGQTPVLVQTVTLDRDELSLSIGGTYTLKATVLPANASNKALTWKSNDASIASVAASGQVIAVKPGTTTITATAGGVSARCTVTVAQGSAVESIRVSSISISGKDRVGDSDTIQLTATVLPANASVKTVAWTSADPTVATVDASGVVTGVKPGTVAITATATDGSNVKATKTITVVNEETLGDNGELTWTLSPAGVVSFDDADNTELEAGDTIFVSLWGADNSFKGVKIINAQALEAAVGSAWDHLKLMWVGSDTAPKCDDQRIENEK